MKKEFIEVLLYTNQVSLKRYLSTSEITIACNEDRMYYSLSDNGYGGLLVFNKEVSIDDVKMNCCNDDYETAVVLKVLLNKQLDVVAFCENEEQVEGKLGDFENAIAYLIKEPISFSNVVSIIPVEKKLVFLQGDTTINVPVKLIDEKYYKPTDYMSTECLESILVKIRSDDSYSDNISDYFDDMDEIDIDSMDLSFKSDQDLLVDSSNNYKNKLLAGVLMLIQGNHPSQNKLNANICSILEDNISFKDYIKENIYKNMPFDISQYVELPDEVLVRFYHDLKNVAYNKKHSKSIFENAINALLNLENNDKEQFKLLFLSGIEDEKIKEAINKCLSDLRARNRIFILKENSDDMLPIYVLYVFFDYGFDRLNENIIEFGLDGSIYVPILLSLWAIKNGMKDIYEEFKNPEIVYACDKKVSQWLGKEKNIIPVNIFFLINKIKLKTDEYVTGNFRCSYINTKIEYKYCTNETVEQIEKSINELEKSLANTFPFQYVELKQALRKINTTNVDVSKHSDSIHKKYLSLIKKTSKNKTTKSKSEKSC